VDNAAVDALGRALAQAGLEVALDAQARLVQYADALLHWNARVNLTAITEPLQVVEKHLVDALTPLAEVRGVGSLLDLGTGAGLPGIPLALALPELQVALVDSVAKKVAFLRQAVATLGLGSQVRAFHVRAEGKPAREGLGVYGAVISRAFADPDRFLPLARAYLAEQGRVVAMLGRHPGEAALGTSAARAGLELTSLRELHLPLSGDPRAVAVFHVKR
jgi:16S rRNA (guanine527-N7)-methyltransferase